MMEKRFWIACLVVETFLDPVYNPEAPPEDHHELRKALAGIVLEHASTDSLDGFAQTLRELDFEGTRNSGFRIARELQHSDDENVAYTGGAIERWLGDFFWLGRQPPCRCSEPTLFCTDSFPSWKPWTSIWSN